MWDPSSLPENFLRRRVAEIDEGAAGFLEYQTGLPSRMGEKVGGSTMTAVQCKIGRYGSFTGMEREKGEWKREAREECEAASRLWHNPCQQNVTDSAVQPLSRGMRMRGG